MIPKWAYLNNKFNDRVYYSGPNIDEDDISAVIYAFINGSWATSGEYVNKFEKEFSKKFYKEKAYSVMVNSGSVANTIMLQALKKYYSWKDGDEIITSVVGFPTTVSAILFNNLKPVFVDVELNTLNMKTDDEFFGKITDKTIAVFMSPVLGNPPLLNSRFIDLWQNGKMKFLLDGCDSLGTKFAGYDFRNYFEASTCSFYPTHSITTLEGGMISSENKKIIDIARKISNWGRSCICVGGKNIKGCKNRFSDWLETGDIVDHRYVFDEIGTNAKPLDLQGALGLSQLKKFYSLDRRRKRNFNTISFLYKTYVNDIRIPNGLQYEIDVSWFAVPIICKTKELKEELVDYLEKNGIQTRHYFAGNILQQPAYKHLGNWRDYVNANEISKRVFFVGCAPYYNDEIFDYIEKVLRRFNERKNGTKIS